MTAAGTQASQLFKDWLGHPTTQDYLAGFVGRKLQSLSVRLPFLLEIRFGRISDPADMREETLQDFLIFLLEQFLPRLPLSPELTDKIYANQPERVLGFAWQKYLWLWQESSRNKEKNPRGYLYRRLRETIRHDPRFFFQPCVVTGGSAYRLRDIDLPSPDPAMLDDDFSSWPPPPPPSNPARRESLFSAEYLAEVACFFWDQACGRLPTPGLLSLRDLVAYLGFHFPWLNRSIQVDEPTDRSAGSADTSHEVLPEEILARRMHLESIDVLGQQFAARLSATACQVLRLRLKDPPCPYEQIARQLGLGGYQQAYRLYKNTEKQLKTFCRNWPGPAVDELSAEVRLKFIESVVSACKTKGLCP